MHMLKSSNLGLLVLTVKLGPKFFLILAKLGGALWAAVKSLFGVKSAGIVGSVGLYTYLLTWQMGVALVVFLAIHEYGHLWAMKRCSIRAVGMFFIPGFGAVALAGEKFGNARNEAYIAIMGPVFGLVGFVLPAAGIYWVTGDALWAAIAAFMAFINLINLLPVLPLDGGRILKTLAYSKNEAISFATIVVVSIVTATLGTMAGFLLLAYMAIIGFWEISEEFGITEHLRNLHASIARAFVAFVLFSLADYYVTQWGNFSVLGLAFVSMLTCVFCLGTIWDIWAHTTGERRSVFLYPLIVLLALWEGLQEVWRLRAWDIQPIEGYDRMNSRGKAWYTLCFLGLVCVHVAIILVLGKVPGVELVPQLLE